jgi:N-methylhydantoinase A
MPLPDAVQERSIDLRYSRQGSEHSIRVPDDVPLARIVDTLARAFHDEHDRQFGYRRPEETILASSVRLRLVLRNDAVQLSDVATMATVASSGAPVPVGTRRAYFGGDNGEVSAPVYSRSALPADVVVGPAIVEDVDTTVVVPPGWQATRGSVGSLVLGRS